MKRNLAEFLTLFAVVSLLLSACGTEPHAPLEASPPAEAGPGEQPAAAVPTEAPSRGPKILHASIPFEGDIPTIDPALSQDTASIQIVQETFIGLTQLNEETSATEPGMAISWDGRANADGTQTLTFHLRDDVPWVRWNGTSVEKVRTCDGSAHRMVTAQDFAYGIQRNLNPANASPYGYLLAFMLKGAADFNNGITADFSSVGVKALDAATLEMTFLSPAVYNEQIAGLWVARPQPRWVIEGDCDGTLAAHGERWTEPGFFQSYGPFTLKEWIHDSSITLVKNPFWPGSESIPQPSIDEVNVRMLDPAASPMKYNSPKPPEILEEDKTVQQWPIAVKEIQVVPLERVFE